MNLLGHAQQPKNLGCQLQIGVDKNLIVDKVSPTTTPNTLISWTCSKLSPLFHYLQCTWCMKFLTCHCTFCYLNSLLVKKFFLSLQPIYNLDIYLVYGSQRQHYENNQRRCQCVGPYNINGLYRVRFICCWEILGQT